MSNEKFKMNHGEIFARVEALYEFKNDKELGDQLGKVSRQAISNYRKGRREFPLSLMIKVSKDKNISLDYLVKGKEGPQSPPGSYFSGRAIEKHEFLQAIIYEVNRAANDKNITTLDLAEILINVLRAECIREIRINPPKYPRRVK